MSGTWREVRAQQVVEGRSPQPRRAMADPYVVSVPEAATLLGMSVRTISYKFPQALDRLTEKLLEAGLLMLPN